MSLFTPEEVRKQEECKMEGVIKKVMIVIQKNIDVQEQISITSKENAIEACKYIQKKIEKISYKELLPNKEIVKKRTILSSSMEKLKNKMVEIAKQENVSNKIDICSKKSLEKTKKELLGILNIMISYITELADEEPA